MTENQEKLKEVHYIYRDNRDFVSGKSRFLIDEKEILANISKITQDSKTGCIDVFSLFWILCFSAFPASILLLDLINRPAVKDTNNDGTSQIFPDIILTFISLIGIGIGVYLTYRLFRNIKLTHYMNEKDILKTIYQNGEIQTGKVSSIHIKNELVEIRFRIMVPNARPYTHRYFVSRSINFTKDDNILVLVWQNYMIPL